MAGRNGAMWAAGQCDSRLHGQEEVAALLRRTLIRLCLKHCVQGGDRDHGEHGRERAARTVEGLEHARDRAMKGE